MKILGKDLVFGVNTFINTFSKNKLTPIAVIKFEILGEFLSGLYAILSARQPTIAQIIIAGITETHTGKPIDDNAGIENNETYAPIIIISPCAKFISCAIPYTIVYPKDTRA